MMGFVSDRIIQEALAELTLEDIPEQYHGIAEALGVKAFGKLVRYFNGHQPYIQKAGYSGIYEQNRDLINAIGIEAFDRLVQMCGSDSPYIPKCCELIIPARNRLINAEFNGYNYFELAKKWDLTDRTIRDIVKGKAKAIKYRPSEDQITFFDFSYKPK